MRCRFIPLLTVILIIICISRSDCYGQQTEKATDALTQLRSSLTAQEKLELRGKMSHYVKMLDEALSQSAEYDKLKDKRIQSLKEALQNKSDDNQKAYNLCKQLTDEYREYNYDSAIAYSSRAIDLAEQIGEKNQLVEAMAYRGYIFLNGGYFRQCERTIERIDTTGCRKETIIGVLLLGAELDYTDSFYRSISDNETLCQRLEATYNKLLTYCDAQSPHAIELRAKISSRRHDTKTTITELNKLLDYYKNDPVNYANTLGKIGFNQIDEMDIVPAMKSLTIAAVQAIKDGSRSYPAIRRIAELMFVVDNEAKAFEYSKVAIENARQLNSRHIIYETSIIFPEIEQQLSRDLELSHRDNTVMMVVAIVLLLMVLAAAGLIVSNHGRINDLVRRVKSQTHTIQASEEIAEAAAVKLEESNFIKDYALNRLIASSTAYSRLTKDVRAIIAKNMHTQTYEKISEEFERITVDLRKRRESFDKMIFTLFPNFVEQINAMMRPECRFPDDGETLTPELRICALVRLGVEKNADLARCLNYSTNTIKSYKTRINNGLSIGRDRFIDKIRAIKFATGLERK